MACIDIGSNTTRLLVAEAEGGGLREVLADRVFTRLPLDGEAIPSERVDAVAAAVARQAGLAREAGAEVLRAVATAGVRRAPDPAAICGAVRAAAGVDVEVLSGDEEAALAFLGATATLSGPAAGEVAVIDVGGGSTEIACGAVGGRIGWCESVPVGSALLTQRLAPGDPPAPDELAALRAAAEAAVAGLAVPSVARGLAVGGSATSLRRLAGERLDPAALERLATALCSAPADEIAALEGLHPERVRLLPAGIAILTALSRRVGVPLEIVCGGLREGVVRQELASLPGPGARMHNA